MSDNFLEIIIFDNIKEFKAWFNIHNEEVEDFIELGDKILVQFRSKN